MPWYNPLSWGKTRPAPAPPAPVNTGVVRLSAHFTTAEFRCKCGCGGAYIAPELIAALEVLRAKAGAMIIINSGFRCGPHNLTVGGSPSSQHLVGRAADIWVPGLTGEELFRIASSIPALHGFGVADRWVHVDVRPGTVARWRYDKQGRAVAWPEDGKEKK